MEMRMVLYGLKHTEIMVSVWMYTTIYDPGTTGKLAGPQPDETVHFHTEIAG